VRGEKFGWRSWQQIVTTPPYVEKSCRSYPFPPPFHFPDHLEIRPRDLKALLFLSAASGRPHPGSAPYVCTLVLHPFSVAGAVPPRTLLVLSEGPAATLQSAASLPTGRSRGESNAGRTAPEKEAPDAAGIAGAVPGAAVAPEIQASVNYLRYRLHQGRYRTIFEISSMVSA
jgi:hypothetical protein